jgi:hypothetical protein
MTAAIPPHILGSLRLNSEILLALAGKNISGAKIAIMAAKGANRIDSRTQAGTLTLSPRIKKKLRVHAVTSVIPRISKRIWGLRSIVLKG